MGKYLAPALDKGLDIIEYLSMKAIPQSQMEISQGLEKSPNEIYRMLVCLEQRGYLIKETPSGKFSLSLKLYHLSHRHSPVDELVKLSKPFMEELSNESKQSCHMGILHHGNLMVVSQMRSPGPVSLSIEEGSLFSLIKTTSGRVLLAFMNETRQKQILADDKDYNELSKEKKADLMLRLQKIRDRGYDLEKSELTMGVADIAVPVGDSQSGIFSALAISSLASISSKNESGEFLINKITEAVTSINTALGF
ncbi:IclR family transcriptional regulator [Ancylomarina sp. 16SWW S1-10-2]|uniref:IclR family transcriptional regulator n=1 Tax=Ancylomarina sp. 16SWW S1-10-2 TaxID=2499681 RepID=UPI0012AD2776|nr:IclR family transcriptional regulator [Ancylomarina sp. 16SWW S1-10-2]MRT92030.1 IclR family transcriptional regulator [Ancylomarina sp. 16SWW S1-10-2]